MAERVPKITQAERPTFNARAYSDRLAETRAADGALDPVPVFDKTKPDSIVPMAEYVKGKLTDTVNALTEFTATHETRIDQTALVVSGHEERLRQLEAARRPFGSRSG